MIVRDNSDPARTPRWWIAIWCLWGAVMGSVVLWLDHDPLTSILWMIAGMAIGTCGVAIARPLSSSIHDWYINFASAIWRDQRLCELAIDEKTDTAEFERLCVDEAFKSMAFIPPTMGLFHGTLLGGIAGAFCGLGAARGISASYGALWGIVFGVIGVAFLWALILAVMAPLDNTRPLRSRISDRVLMVMSPLFVFPIVFHCARFMVKRRRVNAAYHADEPEQFGDSEFR
jgi:hypothetical protein